MNGIDLGKLRFIEAIEGGECPVCMRLEEKETAFIEEILLDSLNDPSFRQKLQESRGFCVRHLRKMLLAAEKRPDLDGVAIADVLRDIIEAEIRDLNDVQRALAEIRSKAAMSMAEEWDKIAKAIRKLFGAP